VLKGVHEKTIINENLKATFNVVFRTCSLE